MSEQSETPYIIVERSGFPLGAFLGGLMIGAAAGLLYAPKSGRETQEDLREGFRRLREETGERLAGLKDEVGDRYTRVRAEVNERIDSARDELTQRKRQAEEAVRAGREAARRAREDLEKRVAESKAEYRERMATVGEGGEAEEEG